MLNVIKFEFLYKGHPLHGDAKSYNWHKKIYSLDQLCEKSLEQLSDVHMQAELIAKRQFTGEVDANKKEIFDGDLIQIPDDYDEYGQSAGEVYEVYFANGGFRLKPKYGKGRGFWLEDTKAFVVIGNVYQHPELKSKAYASAGTANC